MCWFTHYCAITLEHISCDQLLFITNFIIIDTDTCDRTWQGHRDGLIYTALAFGLISFILTSLWWILFCVFKSKFLNKSCFFFMIKYTKKRHYSCVQYYNCFDVCAFDGEHTHALFSIGGRNTEKHKVISVICSCKSSAFQGYIQDHVYA